MRKYFSKKNWVQAVFLACGLVLTFVVFLPLKADELRKDSIVVISPTNFQKEVLKSDIPVLVDFWAPWCEPCRSLALTVDKIAKDFEGRLKVAKVNVDDNGSLASRYSLWTLPTVMIFKNGRMAKKWVGVVGENDLRSGLKHLAKVNFR